MVIGSEQLDELQKDFIGRYAKGAHQEINRCLRNDPRFDIFGNIEIMWKVIDSIFDLTPVRPNPAIVFRGTKNDNMYNNPAFSDKGFVSTTSVENIALDKFITSENHLLLKIHLHCSNINLLEIDGKEHEYLFPRNTRFKVLYKGGEIKTAKNQMVPYIGICPF